MPKGKDLTIASISALNQYNTDYGKDWSFGSNWTNVATDFETFVNKYLFPKINETSLINVDLGNRFDWLAKEVAYIGQYSEEYVILDAVPVSMNLTKEEELMLKRNYPNMATRLYGAGYVKKQKFTLNNNDVRVNFMTLADGVAYALAVFKKRISDINVFEEKEIKAMLVDYSLSSTLDRRNVVSKDDLLNEVFNALLNLQNNSDKYNETSLASGGAIGRYTTNTNLDDVAILTTDKMKTFLLDTKIANTFNAQGIDFSKRIISFDDLGGVYRINKDVTVNKNTVEFLKTFGDYQISEGDVIPENSVITFDVTSSPQLKAVADEIKPESDLYAYIFDINKLRYRRNTQDMIKTPFYNGEYDEVTYWIHYYSSKAVSPFFNNILIGENVEKGD